MAEPQLTGRAEAFALSTRELAPEDRTAAWQAALSRVLVDVEVSPVPGTDPWTGTLRAERFGALRIVTEETGAPVTIVRTSTAAAADKRSPVLLRQQLHGSALLLQDGRATRLGPGGLAFHDASRPFKLVITSDQRARILMLPRALLRLEEARLRLLTATVLDGAEDAPAALLLPLLSGLAEETLTAAPAQRERLARATADLVAVLALHQAGGPAAEERRPGAALLDRIKTYVETRLGDPGLSPQDIADRHGISLRYLHQLFQRQGTTVNSWVRASRLESAREELARPDAARRAVAAVAARWGFASPAHFSRVFREAYGMSPVQWRRSSRVARCAGGPEAVHGRTSLRATDS
ncbi:helix-turn-helix domain-containing protein [Streptomyces sp. NBC_01136]|uniref:helix-turn-helix domain-containing protein n=1 Tax=unclassified Streptomyces TaxID=2593676 RepID=UPI0032560BA2|nr:helix-turn-helix domain-containing protein [Streptomyces sp. NBC_01136]